MDQNILSALKAIDVATLTRADWISAGMALKEEGFPVSVWDAWSRNDTRYKTGECARLWEGFHGHNKPVKAGTIVQMAKERGWNPYWSGDGCMAWDDTIEFDGNDGFTGFSQEPWDAAADLITYLSTLFDKYIIYNYYGD